MTTDAFPSSDESSRPRLGMLGGTFDPVHVGHLVAATEVRWALGLDRVLLMLADQPWQKVGLRHITPAADRLAVLRAAVSGQRGIEASTLEVERRGPSYTADTLAQLRRLHPEAELYLIVGADVASELGTWVRVEEVRAAAHLVIVDRPGTEPPVESLAEEGWRLTVVPVPGLHVSSKELRGRVAAGRPIDYLVPAAAVREIRKRNLYASSR